MIVLFILLLAVIVWRAEIVEKPSLGKQLNCFSRQQSIALNGISIILVFICHAWLLCLTPMGYSSLNIFDEAYLVVKRQLGQVVVVTFLFYSGFGCMEQIKEGGCSYLKTFVARRIFVTWANFAIAVLAYAVVRLVINGLDVVDFLLALIGLRQIGNPAWYIVCIIWAYSSIYLVASLVKGRVENHKKFVISGVFVLMMAYIAFTMVVKRGCGWWWDTALIVPIGVTVSLYKDAISNVICRRYYSLLVVSCVMFVVTHLIQISAFGLWNNIESLFFISSVLLITTRIQIGNPILEWAGRHVFPIYMYHMLFFMIAMCLYNGSLTQIGAISVVGMISLATICVAKYYHYWQVVVR